MSDYDDFLARVAAGFKAPTNLPGRCRKCALHITTQGHRDGCPEWRY